MSRVVAEAARLEIENDCFPDIVKNAKTTAEKMKHIDSMKRTDEWLKAAARKLKPVIESFRKLVGNQNHEVRAELIMFADNLLAHCARCVSKCSFSRSAADDS